MVGCEAVEWYEIDTSWEQMEGWWVGYVSCQHTANLENLQALPRSIKYTPFPAAVFARCVSSTLYSVAV